jgi:hypothetical protein
MGHLLYHHTVLITSPGVAIFGCNMLFDILFIANWNKIGDYRQHQTDLNTAHEIASKPTMITKLAIRFC